MILTDNQLCLQHENDIKDICKSLIKLCPEIEYVDYGKIYDDGTCFILSNNHKVVKFIFEYEYKLNTVPESIISDKFYHLVSKEGPDEEFVNELKREFSIHSPLNTFERGKDYFEGFFFTLNTNQNDAVNFYLNHINELENFKKYFKTQSNNIIKLAENSRIKIPENMISNIVGHQLNNKKTNQYLFYKSRQINLTPREIECLHHISRGFSAKDCAKEINISFRTIETHISNIKVKLNCSRKSELIKFYEENFLPHYKV